MSLIANLYGRLGNDPVARTTKSGTAMTTCSIVVDVTAHNAQEPASQWFNVIAFGTAADELLRASKGQMLACIGKLTRGEYTTAAGEVREQWTLIADSVVTAKTAKPAGRPQGQQPRTQSDARRNEASLRFQDPRPFDDPIGF